MLSNGSRGTLMSYTDHSVQRRLKSNAPFVFVGHVLLLPCLLVFSYPTPLFSLSLRLLDCVHLILMCSAPLYCAPFPHVSAGSLRKRLVFRELLVSHLVILVLRLFVRLWVFSRLYLKV